MIKLRPRILVLWVVGAAMQLASAQSLESTSPHGLSAKVLLVDYSMANEMPTFRPSNGIEFGYYRKLHPRFQLGVPLKIAVGNLPDQKNMTVVTELDVTGQYFPFSPTATLKPYLLAGAGITKERNADSYASIPLGLGAYLALSPTAHIALQGEYRISGVENRNNWQLGAGYFHQLTQKSFEDKDRDKDGFNNGVDLCPTEKGTILGCPDRDEDGVADKDDACPWLFGLKELDGCPPKDSDNDGFGDDTDPCPTQAGSLSNEGCPDTDGDEVPDHKDDCPFQAGTPDNKGCPIQDSDNDGVADANDDCPNQPGTVKTKGCPDTDQDGVPDREDNCPTVAGTTYSGCPDTDGDGLEDHQDKCPSIAGTLLNKGCPEIEANDKEVFDIAMRDVQFENGSADLLPQSRQVLNQVKDMIEKYPQFTLYISGHTDNVGDPAANKFLSEARARTCFDYLRVQGVDPAKIRYSGYGDQQPFAPNTTEAGRNMNRRVEFELRPN